MSNGADFIEAEAFLVKHPATTAVDLLITDTNGLVRGKRIKRDALSKAYREGICLPGSVFAAMITGDTVEATGLGFDEGDADRICWPLAGTLKPVPWSNHPRGQVLMSMSELDGQPFFADPRHVLSEVIGRFIDMKLTPVVAVEMEFYLIDRKRTPQGGPQPPISPATGKRERATQVYGINELDDYEVLLGAIAEAAEIQDIPAETAVAEYAPGQYEVNLRHQTDALLACDHAMMLKRLIKGVALKHGMEATFMAKPYAKLAGNGMHVHISLLNEHEGNMFQAPEPPGSTTLRHAIGGLATTMAESMAVFAPNANSYRRFQAESYAPLSPSWGTNNRTVALRIPAGPAPATRIEHRVAGADANPYLLVASLLAGIHYGITRKIEPEPPVDGNAYDQQQLGLPVRWLDALALFQDSVFAIDYLGKAFCGVYATNKLFECKTFERYVTPLEHEWYLRTV